MRARLARVGLVSLLLLSSLGMGCREPEERAAQARAEAQEALARGQRSEALVALEELRESRPDTPKAVLEFATLLVRAGEAPQAVWELREAVARFPEHHALRIALANASLLLGDGSGAKRAVEEIPPDSEQHAEALVARARAELLLGELEQALETFAEAETTHPEIPELRLNRIGTLLQDRRFDDARAALAEARESIDSPEGRTALRRLEVSLHRFEAAEGETEAAIEGLREMVEEDPEDLQAWNTLVQLLWHEGRLEEARAMVSVALEEAPARVGLHALLASLEAALGDREAAEQTLRERVARSPSPTAFLTLALFLAAGGDAEASLATFAEAIEAFPDAPVLRSSHAEARIDFGDLDAAREEIDRVREMAPGNPMGEFLRARLTLAEGDAEDAVAKLERLIPDFDNASGQFWLGRALEMAGDRAGAERRYGLALVRDPTDPAAGMALVRLAQERGDWRRVAVHAGQLVQRLPGLFESWKALMIAFVHLGEGESAEQIARSAMEAYPDRAETGTFLALALREQGRYAEALDALDRVREHFGDTPELQAERALILGMSGRVEEALAAVDSALADHADTAALHATRASLLFRLGRAEEGSRAADRALELAPEDLRPLRDRARFGAATGRLDAALRDAEAYLAGRPDDAEMHFVHGVVHQQAGRAQEAIAAFRRAAELDERAVGARNNLAELLAARGELDAALAAAQEAFAIEEDNPYVMDTLGSLYLRKGLVDRAISVLEDAHAAAPQLAEAQLHLALAYREAGRTEQSERLLTALRARDGVRPELRAQVDEALVSLR